MPVTKAEEAPEKGMSVRGFVVRAAASAVVVIVGLASIVQMGISFGGFYLHGERYRSYTVSCDDDYSYSADTGDPEMFQDAAGNWCVKEPDGHEWLSAIHEWPDVLAWTGGFVMFLVFAAWLVVSLLLIMFMPIAVWQIKSIKPEDVGDGIRRTAME